RIIKQWYELQKKMHIMLKCKSVYRRVALCFSCFLQHASILAPLKGACLLLVISPLILQTASADNDPVNIPFTHPHFDVVDSLLHSDDSDKIISYLHFIIKEFDKEANYKGQVM